MRLMSGVMGAGMTRLVCSIKGASLSLICDDLMCLFLWVRSGGGQLKNRKLFVTQVVYKY